MDLFNGMERNLALNGLELPLVTAIRRNHGLEHATMHSLAEHNPALQLVGRSDWGGFTLYGDVEIGAVADATLAALSRLHSGEGGLAIHPRCGTNLATGVLLAGVATWAALRGKRKPWFWRTVQLLAGLAAARALSRPLGERMQRLTTSANVAHLRVLRVERHQLGQWTMHRVITSQD